MQFPILFKRTTTGKIQQWQIEVRDNFYRTISGQVDGKLVTSNWTECFPKNVGKANATTAEEQAIKQAEALYKKQLEKHYFENIKKVDKIQFVKPMLAHKYDDVNLDFDNFGYYSQPKLDGIRCILNKDGMWTRAGKKMISAPHIYDSIKHVFNKHPDFVFDGEIYTNAFANDFNKITSLAKKTKPTKQDLEESANWLEYWVYDHVSSDGFKDRFETLEKIFDKFVFAKRIECLKLCPTIKVNDENHLDELYQEYLINGYEGQMIRTEHSTYEGKRTKNLLKRKDFIDDEFTIIDVKEGQGNWSGMCKSLRYQMPDGTVFDTGVRGTQDYCKWLLENKNKVIGKQATVRYQNVTPDGAPRFGVTHIVHLTERW